jgi:23S rRNA pseudouridine2605 synthase
VPEPERLQKVLARAGVGSRRVCDDLIAAGRVTIDGVQAELGNRVDPQRQRIAVDGVPVVANTDAVYYLLNKPEGVITTASDPEGRATVVELVPAQPRVFPVGRLDADTEGLLILTNDGDLAQLLSHPSHGVDKTYLAEVIGYPTRHALRLLREGVELDDGPAAPAKVSMVANHGDRSAIEVTIHEGRNRQVRRMCDAVGHPVVRLVRTRIGPLHDQHLSPGEWRPLRAREIQELYAAGVASEAPTNAADPEPSR